MHELDEVGGIESREDRMEEVKQGSAIQRAGQGDTSDPVGNGGRPRQLEKDHVS